MRIDLSFNFDNRETLIKYAKAIHELFVQISGKLADGLGLSNFTIEGWPFQFRINKYNFAEETVGSSGVQIHTDSGFLTILQDDEGVGGLEVMDTTGAFLPVDPWPNTLVVNLGDVATVSDSFMHNVPELYTSLLNYHASMLCDVNQLLIAY